MSESEQIKALTERRDQLEEAITNASILICESREPECKAEMRVFDEVMDAEARRRVGI